MADRVVFEPGTLRTQGTELPRPTITIIIFFIKQQQLQKGYGNKQGSTIIIYLSTMSSRVSLELRLCQIWPVLFIHSFITEIYIAPLQGYYSEALPTLARLKRRVLRLE